MESALERVVKTICQMCYFYCGLDVTVRDGQIIKIEGMNEHPGSKGRLCPRGLACQQLVNDPNRLRTPLKRVGERGSGKWEPISWTDAIGSIAEKMLAIKNEYGPHYCGYYRGQAPGWVTNFNYVWRLMNSWGSPNLFTHSHLCFVPRALAHAATFGRFPEPDYENTKCILLIGYNPVNTSPVNYASRILWAKQRGAKLIVCDPRFTNTASKADLFLQERPGTTGALILAMIQAIIAEELYDVEFVEKWTVGFDRLRKFIEEYTPERCEEITWVPAEKIRQAARMIAQTKPAVVVDGNGLDQHTNTVQTVRATSILRALIGSLDVPGGSVMVPALPFVDVQRRGSQPKDFYAKAVGRYPLYAAGGFGLNGVDLTDSLISGKPFTIRSLIVQGGDPVAVLSDSSTVTEALERLDFLVVHDLYPNATSQIADLILPAASFLERDLVLNYRYRPSASCNLIAMQNQCVEPVGESKTDLEFIFELARALGLEEHFPWEKATEAFDWELEANGISVQWLRDNPGGYKVDYPPDELYRKYEKEGFVSTPSKKVELYSRLFEEKGMDPLPTFVEPSIGPVSSLEVSDQYPLVCSAGLKLGLHTHTQFRSLPWIKAKEPEPFGEIHPDTASDLNVGDGEWMRVVSPQGSLKVKARVCRRVHPRIVCVTHGYGEPYTSGDGLCNEITSQEGRDPIAGCTGNRSFLCRVEKAEA